MTGPTSEFRYWPARDGVFVCDALDDPIDALGVAHAEYRKGVAAGEDDPLVTVVIGINPLAVHGPWGHPHTERALPYLAEHPYAHDRRQRDAARKLATDPALWLGPPEQDRREPYRLAAAWEQTAVMAAI